MAKSKSSKSRRDPYLSREKKKYARPIPSREFIVETMIETGCPITLDEIVLTLKVQARDTNALEKRLKAMVRDGQLIRNRKSGYCVVDNRELISGRIIGHKDGFGFLSPDDGSDDLFLLPKEMRKVMHNDRVVGRVSGIDRKGRLEAVIIEVLERAHKTIVGKVHLEGGVGFLKADNRRIAHEIIIPGSELNGATEGDIVVAELIVQPSKRAQAVGRIIEVLGAHMRTGMESDIAIRSHEIPVKWPGALKSELARFGDEVSEEDKKDRVDLRHLPWVTIDGEDARDFDDALVVQPTPKGWKLYVAIADVSYYVRPSTALDKEANTRGNSVYFPDRVIPMLPEKLSNGLCSLNPGTDRLCLVCEMLITRHGKTIRSRFYRAVMHSSARLTYTEVAAILTTADKKSAVKYKKLIPHLEQLYRLYQSLLDARRRRGAIEFETLETRILFDREGRISNIIPSPRNEAHRIVEECMLAANVAAAALFIRKQMPVMFRIHEGPSLEKLADLREFLKGYALNLGGGAKPTSKDYTQLLNSIKHRVDAGVIQSVLLRSMSQAVYSTTNLGHFGLAYPAYTHFTSPIRRYPDLLVHRAIKHLIDGGLPKDFEYKQSELQSMAEQCSVTERRADDATRDVLDTLKCEYMLDKIGKNYNGVVTQVTSFGLFVILNDIQVTGLVHITALDKDYFHYDPVRHKLTGERTGLVYKLGSPLKIKVAAVDVDDRKIDFVLTDQSRRKRRKASKRK